MDLIAQHQLDKASQIYYCVVKSVGDNECTIVFNNKQYTVPYYGGKPTPNKTYAIFLPHNNMNESFVIGDGKDGGTEGEIVPITEGGTGADNAADARTNLGLGDVATENVVPLNKGGTGADNAADARTNLAVLPLAGGTLTGKVTNTYGNVSIVAQHGTANKDAGFDAKRTDTGISVFFGVGANGVAHGIYSYKLGKWMVYADGSNVHCNGTATNVTGTVTIDHGGTGATTAAAARTNLGVPTLLDVYPVGSIYMSVNSTSPATLFGGTWEQLKDRFLLAAGSTYSAGSTGGSSTMAHTHTMSHTHNLDSNGYAKMTLYGSGAVSYKEKNGVTTWTANYRVTGSGAGGSVSINSTDGAELGGRTAGSSAANTGAASNTDNMPPYLTVYMWKRTK